VTPTAKKLLQGNPVLRGRAKGAFSLLLSLAQAKKVTIMVLTLWFNIKKIIITTRFAQDAEFAEKDEG